MPRGAVSPLAAACEVLVHVVVAVLVDFVDLAPVAHEEMACK